MILHTMVYPTTIPLFQYLIVVFPLICWSVTQYLVQQQQNFFINRLHSLIIYDLVHLESIVLTGYRLDPITCLVWISNYVITLAILLSLSSSFFLFCWLTKDVHRAPTSNSVTLVCKPWLWFITWSNNIPSTSLDYLTLNTLAKLSATVLFNFSNAL